MRASLVGMVMLVGGSTACGDEVIEPPARGPLSTCQIEGDYCVLSVRGWTLNFGLRFISEALPRAEDVYHEADGDLQRIEGFLPPHVVNFLQGTNLWFELNYDIAFEGGVYHPSADYLIDNGYPAIWAEGVHFPNARNFLEWREIQPAMVFHELAHAWHHQFLGFDNRDIMDAYDAAMAEGLYDEVEYVNGNTTEAYATVNAVEYFAELSEAWFWENDFYPFKRQRLLMHDPVGASVVQALWE